MRVTAINTVAAIRIGDHNLHIGVANPGASAGLRIVGGFPHTTNDSLGGNRWNSSVRCKRCRAEGFAIRIVIRARGYAMVVEDSLRAGPLSDFSDQSDRMNQKGCTTIYFDELLRASVFRIVGRWSLYGSAPLP